MEDNKIYVDRTKHVIETSGIWICSSLEDKEDAKKINPLPRAKSQPSDRLVIEQKTLACR